MAVQANTLGRAKSMGVGALTNAQGLAIISSIFSSSHLLVGAVPVRWSKYLKSAYSQVPSFLKGFEAEAKKEAAEARSATGAENGALGALSALGGEERLAAVRNSLRDMAREVVDSLDLESDNPLMDAGMDSLSGVEFRNRLQREFDGINLPNSMVFDYPTIAELAGFINSQLDDSPESPTPPVSTTAVPPQAQELFLEPLNGLCNGGSETPASKPVFLIPGAGMQAGSFRALAARLALASYGLSWPKNIPREEWPSSLKDLAELFFVEIQKVQPTGPYILAGHSFGANVCLEIAAVASSRGQQVSMALLLDPRSLLPLHVDVQAEFAKSGLAESLALLAHTLPGSEGARYAELLNAHAGDGDEAIRRALSPGALSSLVHVHETTQWYSALLQKAGEAPRALPGTKVAVLRAPVAWTSAKVNETVAERIVREFQALTFQDDQTVASQLSSLSETPEVHKVPGTHFSMLHEPNVMKVAFKVLSALYSAEEDEG